MENLNYPDYRRIYSDIIEMNYPDKHKDCESILAKEEITLFDVLILNKIIFKHEDLRSNQKHRSYDRRTIEKILSYQIKNKLNNSSLALHFNLSRNTVAKWKKQFL